MCRSECAWAAMASEPRRQQGFILAITLWLLAGIAVVVGLMTWWAQEQVRGATVERDRIEAEAAMLSTTQTVIYLAVTRDMTRAGIPTTALADDERSMRLLDEMGGLMRDPIGGELSVDGSVYLGLGDTRFTIQDESGLFPLVFPSDQRLDALLFSQGVQRELIPRLRDTLLDYIDADDLRRLNGAESREYRQARQPEPLNRRLLLPVELDRVLGWDELPEAVRRRLPDLVTTYYGGAVNLNTSPPELLPIHLGGCPETCQLLAEQRTRRPFANSVEVLSAVGTRLEGDPAVDYRYMPAQELRLTVWGGTGAALRMHVRLSPLADQSAPWAVLAAYPVPRPASDDPARTPEGALFSDPQTADR
ncbi:general secretion pathway protein GspK [Luteimonas yindakuii]|uniref:General secretion pathway protein GspK n=2 Tax=Luteimonas yindakuii TaxID=2565782 RepID=A0A4Z1RFF1_9GAMM|nr:general secretion pathway protein GspK [Luteimonas yindakuii]